MNQVDTQAKLVHSEESLIEHKVLTNQCGCISTRSPSADAHFYAVHAILQHVFNERSALQHCDSSRFVTAWYPLSIQLACSMVSQPTFPTLPPLSGAMLVLVVVGRRQVPFPSIRKYSNI